jgi:hypothetical protein
VGWRGDGEASLNTATYGSGSHQVKVINQGTNGTAVEDQAWNVRFTSTAPTAAPSPTPTTIPTATPTANGPPSLRIVNPLSHQTVAGQVNVRAEGQNLSSVTYQIGNGATVPMTYSALLGWWQATWNTQQVANGYYDVTVRAQGADGTQLQDRAWQVQVQNGASAVTPTSTPAGGAPPTIRIDQPVSNQTYRSVITVQAVATGAASVSYQVDQQPPVSMGFDAASGFWSANLDTRTVADGYHNVTVTNQGSNGTAVWDRAWNVQFSN